MDERACWTNLSCATVDIGLKAADIGLEAAILRPRARKVNSPEAVPKGPSRVNEVRGACEVAVVFV